ncbi:hypothetical protein [Amycolatopsis decaplanina]|nr:hypothetical protein [Amycolatopsis decaplanina]
MNIGKFGLAATGAVMAFGSLFAATPATAATSGEISIQQECRNAPYYPSVAGGWAEFTVRCGGNTVTVSGRVVDTSADNRCARIKVYWPSENRTSYSPKACPEGQSKDFTLYGLYAANPQVTLYTERAGG